MAGGAPQYVWLHSSRRLMRESRIYVRVPVRMPGFLNNFRIDLLTRSASSAHFRIAFWMLPEVIRGRSFSLGPSIKCEQFACCLYFGSRSGTGRRRTHHLSCFVCSINRFRTAYSEFFLQLALTPSQCRFEILRSVGSGGSRCFSSSGNVATAFCTCLLYTSPSPRD